MSGQVIHEFLKALGVLHRGRFVEKCNAEMAKLLAALEEHPDEKVSGTITVTVTVTKLGDRLDVTPKVEAKPPKERGFGGVTFWPLEGGLSVQHPSQTDMFGPRDATTRANASA